MYRGVEIHLPIIMNIFTHWAEWPDREGIKSISEEILKVGRIVSSGRLRRVALVRTDVSEELSSSIIRVIRIRELRKTLALTNNRRTLRRNKSSQLALFLVHWFLSLWWRRGYLPPKRRFLQEPHDVTSQKTPFFIVIAVKTSDLTWKWVVFGQVR
jgi:hypothetical protein